MFNKKLSVKLSDIYSVKSVIPDATIEDIMKMKRNGDIDDILNCRQDYPNASVEDISTIVASRQFIRWYHKNEKIIKIASFAVPALALTMFNLIPGSFALDFLTGGSTVAYAMEPASTVAYGTNFVSSASTAQLGSQISGAIATSAFGATALSIFAGAPSANFFQGHGVILLHMLIIGFITMVVCSFLKFTGRGDLIPLVAFVGCGVILYEVIGLFNAIYGAIKTMLSM